MFPKRSAKMIHGTEKPKIPSKNAKRAARYNEFRCNVLVQDPVVQKVDSATHGITFCAVVT